MSYGASEYGTTPYGAEGGAPIEPPYWPVALALEVIQPTVTPSWPLALSVTGTVTPSWPLSLAVVDPVAITDSLAFAWSRVVRVGGVDWSASLTGPSEVDAEAGASALARVTLRLPAGAFDPAAWVNAPLLLDYVWRDPVTATAFTLRVFTGVVDTFNLDPARRTITLRGVDRRKALLLGASQAQIASLLPDSLWSDAYFDAEVDGLRYAEDRLATLCADFDLAADGSPRLTPWEAKATADWSISRIEAGSLRLEFAGAAELVHQVRVDLDYRFTRLRRREARIRYVFDQLDIVTDHIGLPTSALVEEAVQNAGWEVIEPPVYRRPPEWFEYSGTFYLLDDENGVMEATARIGKRFGQSVEEHFALTVSASASGIDPRLRATISGALECPFDLPAWERDAAAAPVLAAPGWGMETASDATTDPATGRAAAQAAVRCGLAMATRQIRASHRKNSLTFTVPFHPFISTADTVELTQTGLHAIGKVARVAHALDPDGGLARTTLTLAMSRPSLSNPAVTSPHTPPASPAIPAPAQAVMDAHYMELGNIIGAKAGSPPFDEAWSGWIVNIPSENKVEGMITRWSGLKMTAAGEIYGQGQGPAFAVTSSSTPASKFDGAITNGSYVAANAYPVQFRVVAPEVEAIARGNLDIDLAADYLVRVPEDVFSYTI